MWTPDRTNASRAFAVGALVLGFTVVLAHGPAPVRRSRDASIALAPELVALANRGAAARWIVTYAFTRTTTGGQTLHSTLVDAHRPPLDIESGLGSVVVTVGAHAYSCTTVGPHAQCLTPATVSGTTRPGDVFGGAVVSGRYTLARGETRVVAGLRAHCYELKLRTGAPVAGIGVASEHCYSADGVPLATRITRAGATDARTALVVRRTVGRAELAPILKPYGLTRFLPST